MNARNFGIPPRTSDPAAIYDHSQDFYDNVVWVEPPGYVQLRERRARILRIGVAAVIILVLTLYGALLVSGQAVP